MGMHSKKKKQKSLRTRTQKIIKEKQKADNRLDESSFLMEVDKVMKQGVDVGEKRRMNPVSNIQIASRALQNLDYIPCSVKDSSKDLAFDSDDKTTRAYAAEVRKTISAADIIIQVLDARDPFGSRSKQIEDLVIQSGKRLVLMLNKIDLVPKDNVKNWLAVLRKQLPTIAFKASTQEQQKRLGRLVSSNLHTDSSKCIGADLVMKLLKNYARNKDIKTTIRVGVVGYPNVGKSSVINSLKRQRTCQTGAVPGVTRQLQEVELDKNIRLIDSPGVVLASKSHFDPVEAALKNALRVDTLKDPVSPVQGVLRRCSVQVLMEHFQISEFNDHETFLALVAKKLGRLRKGGRPDMHAAAKHVRPLPPSGYHSQVLHEWNSGQLKYYTEPPVLTETPTETSTELLTTLSAEFDLEALDEDVKVVLEETAAMEDDKGAVEPVTRVVSAIKKNKDKPYENDTVSLITQNLKIIGNVRLDTAIKQAYKKNKRRVRKLNKKTDDLADMFSTLGEPDKHPVEVEMKEEDA